MWLTLLARLWYLPVMAALAGVATYYHIDRDHVQTSWQARWDARDKAEWQAAYQVEQAHQQALEAAQKRNADIEAKLNDTAKERDSVARDRDTARRLLSAAIAAADSGAVPQGPDQPGPAAPGGTGGNAEIGGLLAAAFTECRRNADRLDAIVAELTPQL